MAEIDSFSGGYYMAKVFVEAYNETEIGLGPEVVDYLSRELDTEEPIVIKLDDKHFLVHSSESLHNNILGLPIDLVRDLEVDTPKTDQILIPKRQEQAADMLWPDENL